MEVIEQTRIDILYVRLHMCLYIGMYLYVYIIYIYILFIVILIDHSVT
jgi:hypothetical protein